LPKKQEGLFNKAKAWWQTDTAKAVATIVAVLLVPATVIAWNYASNGQTSTDQSDENQTKENGDQIIDEDSAITDETSGNESQPEENITGEDAGATEDTAVGGINDVTSLPDTSSIVSYIVEKGDNVYTISMKVCENDSFYRNNMGKNYLKVGQEIEINCD